MPGEILPGYLFLFAFCHFPHTNHKGTLLCFGSVFFPINSERLSVFWELRAYGSAEYSSVAVSWCEREKRRMSTSNSNSDGGELHVLAVDDSSVDRKLIEKLLRNSSYRVTTVDSGKRALELLGLGRESKSSPKPKAPRVNMIITDYCMPEMTGYDLLKRVKESSALREIPVVIVSSENVPNRISRCLEEGADDFLLKPLRSSDVSRLRSRMAQQRRC